jgi:hypothetical protein
LVSWSPVRQRDGEKLPGTEDQEIKKALQDITRSGDQEIKRLEDLTAILLIS